MSFNYLNLTFSDVNGAVTNVTNPVASNQLSPQVYAPIGCESLSFFGTVDVNTPSAADMASASKVTSSGGKILFTKTAHGLYTGLVGQFTTDNALPTNINAVTDYYVIRVTADTFKVATTLANALANTAVAYSNTGTGTQTFTPTALASASIYLQGSNDQGQNWVTIPNTSTTITADASFGPIEVDYIRYERIRAYATLASGMMSFSPLQIGYRGV